MDLKKILKEFGMSENESKIYLLLIDRGSTTAGKIAKETKIQRSSCYQSLTTLLAKGMISYVLIGMIKYFQAVSPERILEIQTEKTKKLKDALPQLKNRYKQNKKEGQVRLFKGKQGVRVVLKDILENAEKNDVFGDDGQLRKNMPFFRDFFVRELEERKIKTRVLTRPKKKRSFRKTTSHRYVPEETESVVSTNIYEEKIAIIVWTNEPEAILIENKEAAKSYRAYFNFMWKNAEKKIEKKEMS